jgi:hypothetical protein
VVLPASPWRGRETVVSLVVRGSHREHALLHTGALGLMRRACILAFPGHGSTRIAIKYLVNDTLS